MLLLFPCIRTCQLLKCLVEDWSWEVRCLSGVLDQHIIIGSLEKWSIVCCFSYHIIHNLIKLMYGLVLTLLSRSVELRQVELHDIRVEILWYRSHCSASSRIWATMVQALNLNKMLIEIRFPLMFTSAYGLWFSWFIGISCGYQCMWTELNGWS